MTRLHFIIALGVTALLFAWMTWFYDVPAEKILTNRTDPFGLSGKTVLEMKSLTRTLTGSLYPVTAQHLTVGD